MSRDPGIVAECCFVDIGQGSCNILLWGQRKAVVIDCGPRRALPAIQILRYFGVERIEALIVSHNDDDHSGGAELILSAYRGAIDQIYFLEDRPSKNNWFLARVRQELERGALSRKPCRLEEGTILEDSGRNLKLRALYPSMIDNIDARDSGRPNATCGVLRLECGRKSILFPGDVGVDEIRRLTAEGKNPICVDIVTAPHHGGSLTTTTGQSAYSWVYENAIRCKFAVVSVGTANTYRHPMDAHIKAITKSGATVLCTQITRKCCDDLESLRPGVRRPSLPSASKPVSDLTSSARSSKNVACAGTILVELGPDALIINGIDDHKLGVDGLCAHLGGHPMCRDRTAK